MEMTMKRVSSEEIHWDDLVLTAKSLGCDDENIEVFIQEFDDVCERKNALANACVDCVKSAGVNDLDASSYVSGILFAFSYMREIKA